MNMFNRSRSQLAFAALAALVAMSATADPTLVSQAGALYDFNNDTGELDDGTAPGANSDACDTCFTLYVDTELFNHGTALAPPFDAGSSNREAVYGPVTMANGINVTRKVYVPATGANFARYLDSFANPTGSSVTFTYRLEGNWGADGDGVIEATSSGDRNLTSVDRWWVSSDASTDNGGTPSDAVVTVLLYGTGGPLAAPGYISLNEQDRDNGSGDNNAWEYELTVAAGKTASIMFFVGLVDTADDGVALAGGLDNLGNSGMLTHLSADEIASVRNWGAADADNDGVSDYLESLGITSLDADDDDDGLTAVEEFDLGTDPVVADTDGDGLDDGTEATLGTSPLMVDSNGDGLDDIVDWALGRTLGSGTGVTVDANGIHYINGDAGVVARVDVVTDTDGNYHYAFTGSMNEGGLSLSDSEVWYGKLTADGSSLIDPVRVSTFDCLASSSCKELRPRIGVSPNMAYIYVLWDDNNNSELRAVRVNGSTGSVIVAETTAIAGRYHPSQIVVEDDGDFYFATDACSDIRLHALDKTITEQWTKSLNAGSICHANADIAVDADGRLHIVFGNTTDALSGAIVVSYALVDPSLYDVLDTDAMVLIASTAISPDDDIRDNHANVMVDADGLVYVVYANGKATATPTTGFISGAGEVYFTVLDPGADDQDGSASTDATLTQVPDIMLTDDDGVQSWYVDASWGSDGNIHIIWADQDNPFYTAVGDGGTYQRSIFHMSIDTDGDETAAASQVTTRGLGGRRNTHFMFAGDRAFWIESAGKRVVATRTMIDIPVGEAIREATSTTSGSRSVQASVNGGSLVRFNAMELSGMTAAQIEALPLGEYAFENGFYEAVITQLDSGSSVELTVTFPEAVDSEAVLWKWNPVDEWQQIQATVNGQSVTVTLTDGGTGDADGIANGVIVDPAGPGTLIASQVNVTGGGGGGCVIGDENRPLDPLFPALLALAAAYFIRRRMTN